MKDLITEQSVRKRRYKAFAIGENAFREILVHKRSIKEKYIAENARKKLGFGEILLCIVFALSFLTALGVIFSRTMYPVFPGKLLSNMGGTADPLYLKAINTYAGLEKDQNQELSTDEGILLDAAETFSWITYTVQRGDTISEIALEHSLSMDSIIALNGVTNVKRLYAGSQIKIPNMDGLPYIVKNGDSLIRIANTKGIPVEAILDANDLYTDVLQPGQSIFLPGAKMNNTELKLALGELFIYPIRGRLTSPYGWRNDPFTGVRRFHAAIDLAASTGTPIKASQDGRVSALGTNASYGNYIIISHDSGFQTLYAHLSSFKTQKGRYVYQGQTIGAVGNTGYSTGPHLHFAVYKNGRALNPLSFLD
jgi:murein DD-endopeptidase MepM/ murein hydrolase activator NlpD